MRAHSERADVFASDPLTIANSNEWRALGSDARCEPIRARNADRNDRESDQGGECQAERCKQLDRVWLGRGTGGHDGSPRITNDDVSQGSIQIPAPVRP